jgi:signal peptide peptidase SppA
MQRQLILSQFASTPWAMDQAHLQNMAAVLHRWSAGEGASAETMVDVHAAQAARQTRKAATPAASGGIAVLPLWGVMTQRANMVNDISGAGGTSTQQFTQLFRDAMADDSVGGILISIDSPGGSVFGTQELAAEIYQARGKKPIVGFVDSTCASAAYWVASQCDELYSTAGGMTGSIGVYMQHVDEAAAMEKAGIKAEFISAGRYKVEGNSLGPLSTDARAHLQSQVDTYYTAFTNAVAQGRGVSPAAVRGGMGQGRCLMANDALKAGMINGIDTFQGVAARMSGRVRMGGATHGSLATGKHASQMTEREITQMHANARRRQLEIAMKQ